MMKLTMIKAWVVRIAQQRPHVSTFELEAWQGYEDIPYKLELV